jgi:HTH-type transcriptional regulator / antitoxin HigA
MRAVQQTIKHWEHIVSYVHMPDNEREYQKLLAFVDELMNWSRHHTNEHTASLLNLIAGHIETYENQHYSVKKISSVDMLKFLMEEHNLGQNDLPEIGSQSLVSKILNGTRQLTLDHIRNLSKRFGVSPSIFI